MKNQDSDDYEGEQYAKSRFGYYKRLFEEYEGRTRELRLPCESVSDHSFEIFAQNCHRFSKLQTIDFSSNCIRDQGFKKLGQNIHSIPKLKKLEFRHNKIVNGIKNFCDLSSTLPQLIEMDLSYNQIDDSGLSALAQNGLKFPKLSFLEMTSNKITDEGLIKFAQNAHKLLSLETFYVGYNNYTDRGLRAIIENSQKFQKLIKFSIHSKLIFGTGFRGIQAKFESLQEIFLDSNKITDSGLKEIISTGLLKNGKIISLAYNLITDEGMKTLMSNGPYPRLQDLRLNMIQISDRAYLHIIKNRADVPKLSRGSITNYYVRMIENQNYKWKQIIRVKLQIKQWLI